MNNDPQSIQFYESVMNTVNDGLWVSDEDDRIIFCNHRMETITGIASEQLVGLRVTTDFPPETTTYFLPLYRVARRHLKPVNYEAPVITPTGRETIQAGSLTPRVVNGKFIGMICTVQDVTEARATERALIAAGEQAQRFLKVVPTIIIALDRGGTITLLNEAGGHILECDPDAAVGLNWIETFIPAERRDEIRGVFSLLMAGATELTEHHENEIVTRRAGTRRLIHWHNTLLRDDTGAITGLLSSGQDVTEVRAAQERLKTIEWMLSPDTAHRTACIIAPTYGDKPEPGVVHEIRDAAGTALLHELVQDFLGLIGSSAAVYEKNGDYALGVFSSTWCRCLGMDTASNRPCSTDMHQEPACGKLQCQGACCRDAATQSVKHCESIDIECIGGLRIYAMPIFAGDEVVGAISFGYGNPPTDDESIRRISDLYGISPHELRQSAAQYRPRPPWLIDIAKQRLATAAYMIGEVVLRKRTENELRLARQREQEAVTAGGVGLWDWELATNNVSFSDEWKRQIGYEPHEIGDSFEEFQSRLHPDDHDGIIAKTQMCIREKREDYAVEFRFRHRDGSYRWILAHGSVCMNAAGDPARMQGSHVDITDRKQAEQDYEMIFSQAINGIAIHEIICNEDGEPVDYTFLKVNAAFKAYTGLTDEILGKRVTDVYPDIKSMDFDWIGTYGQVALSGEPTEFEQYFAPQDRWYHLSVFCPQHGQFAVLFIDITDRKRAEADRLAMEAQLRQAQKLESIGTLASGVAHEINNPINGIMNYAELVKDSLAATSSEYKYCDEIIHESERVATIVRNLLAFSRDERQTHSSARLVDILDDSLSLMRTVIENDQIGLRLDIPKDLPDLKCRSQQIQQVLMNLLTNARDALNRRYPGHDEDKVVLLTVQLLERDRCRWLRTTVEDHGCGISQEQLERIFDPFFTTKDRAKGTGLGLSISHGIVRDHHGRLTVESELNHFTRFHLYLPVDTGEDQED